MEWTREKIAADFREMIPALSGASGVSGFEQDVAALIRDYIKDSNFTLETDCMMNLIAHKKGKGGTKVLVSAHMDEIGLIVRRIDAEGFLWFETVGGISPQQFFGKHVIVQTERGPIDGVVNSIKPGRPKPCDQMPASAGEFYIEVGAASRQEATDMGIEVGNVVSIDYPVLFLGKNRVAGKALDDRALVFLLIELVRLFEDDDDMPDLYAVFSSQEEVGARGAIVAAGNIRPDIAIALDMSLACDIPGVPERQYVNELGKGASIKVMDRLTSGFNGLIADQGIVRDMKQVARERGIPYQLEAYVAGATDASFMQTLAGGIRCGGIQIPMRYVHSYEVCDINDVVDCMELLYYYTKKLGNE